MLATESATPRLLSDTAQARNRPPACHARQQLLIAPAAGALTQRRMSWTTRAAMETMAGFAAVLLLTLA
eukprot:2271830-Pyramimonas_sp.AAC.1